MEMPLPDIMDRFSILILKWINGADVKMELMTYSKECPMNNLFFDLLRANANIWKLEAAIRNGKEESISLEEIGRRALAIRDTNRIRVEIKNKIEESVSGASNWEVKVDHASQD